MDNTTTPFPTQEGPRMPRINPRAFEALNMLDSFIAKAPLTRTEHQQAAGCFQTLMLHIEQTEALVEKQREEIALKNNPSPELPPAKEIRR